MLGVEGFLGDLAIVLAVAALTTVLFQLLRQPVVLGYLLAGLVIGPHVLGVGEMATLHTLSELGVVLLMFSLGLEFSVRKLIGLGPRAVALGTLEVGLVGFLGFLVGQAFGWGVTQSIFLGAILSVSSTMIVAKTFAEERTERTVREVVFGTLVVEDVVAILLIATLSAVARGATLSTGAIVWDFFKLASLLVLFVSFGLLIVPRFLSFVLRTGSPETSLVATVGTCFAGALVAREFGYSAGLGAFLAGSLAAESGQARSLEMLVRPVRDMFAAVFFVSVGMVIDPVVIWEHFPAVLVLCSTVICGKFVAVTLGAVVTGHAPLLSMRAGLSLTQIGEFSFLIAGVALPLGGEARLLYPLAVAVCVITSFTTPFFVRNSTRIATFLDRLLPGPIQRALGLYASWLERLGKQSEDPVAGSRLLRRTFFLLSVDVGIILAIVVGVSLSLAGLVALLEEGSSRPRETLELFVGVTAGVATLPFLLGSFRCIRLAGLLIGSEILPHGTKLDRAPTSQRSMVLAIQLAIFLVVSLVLLAVTQPFLPLLPTLAALFVTTCVVGFLFWRSTHRLQGDLRAGSVMVAEVLSRQGRPAQKRYEQLEELLPGFGKLMPLHVDRGDGAVGLALAELNLRGRTGATVVCISRGEEEVVSPGGTERLQVGDVLVLSGSPDAIRAARALLKNHGEVLEAS